MSRVDRLYTDLKNAHRSPQDFIPLDDTGFDPCQLCAHHIRSDMKADIQWKNFESLF